MAAADAGVKRYFLSSSVCVYRDMAIGEAEMSEDEAYPAHPDNEYGWEKLFAERYPRWEICLYGHVGDGNLHVNVMKPDGMDRETFFATTKKVDEDLFTLVKRHAGSISAEHGIGLLKKPFLSFSRSEPELAVMRSIKRALDPNGILNPGKILDIEPMT